MLSCLRLDFMSRSFSRGNRWRHNRGRQRGWGQSRRDNDPSFESASSDWNDQPCRPGGPPRGLRGREIGMFYARKSRANKEKRERENVEIQFLLYSSSFPLNIINPNCYGLDGLRWIAK